MQQQPGLSWWNSYREMAQSNLWPSEYPVTCMKVKVKSLSHARLFATSWTVAYQAPPSMGFSRQEYWSGLTFFSSGIFPTQGSNPRLLRLLHCKQILCHLSQQGRSPGGGHGNPLQYSCLENSMDRGAWRATVRGIAKSQTWLTLSWHDWKRLTLSLSEV